MRPHDALALKPDLLGDALRSKVLGIRDEVDASQPEILERVASEKAKRARARPVSSGMSRHPVPHSATVTLRIDPEADAADEPAVELDRHRIVGVTQLPVNECARIIGRVRMR